MSKSKRKTYPLGRSHFRNGKETQTKIGRKIW
jgi:hypothetical protein